MLPVGFPPSVLVAEIVFPCWVCSCSEDPLLLLWGLPPLWGLGGRRTQTSRTDTELGMSSFRELHSEGVPHRSSLCGFGVN